MMRVYYVLMRVVYWLSWPITGLLLHNSHRVRVLVQSEGSILLLKSSYGPSNWSLPGGGIDRDESGKSAAIRELIEETGIHAEVSDLRLLSTQRIAASRLGWPVEEISFFTLNLPKKADLSISRPLEIKALAWVDVSKLSDKISPAVSRASELLNK